MPLYKQVYGSLVHTPPQPRSMVRLSKSYVGFSNHFIHFSSARKLHDFATEWEVVLDLPVASLKWLVAPRAMGVLENFVCTIGINHWIQVQASYNISIKLGRGEQYQKESSIHL